MRLFRRPPDQVIGTPERPYLKRWHVIPRNRWFNVYLHKFEGSDDDRALHDHPWIFNCSILLKGSYIEITQQAKCESHEAACALMGQRKEELLTAVGKTFMAGHGLDAPSVKLRFGKSPHRVLLVDDDEGNKKPCWTLFITGPRVREWGFYCPQGWRHWRDFTAPHNPGEIGRGCD